MDDAQGVGECAVAYVPEVIVVSLSQGSAFQSSYVSFSSILSCSIRLDFVRTSGGLFLTNSKVYS